MVDLIPVIAACEDRLFAKHLAEACGIKHHPWQNASSEFSALVAAQKRFDREEEVRIFAEQRQRFLCAFRRYRLVLDKLSAPEVSQLTDRERGNSRPNWSATRLSSQLL